MDLGIVAGDVTDKGVPAALVMARALHPPRRGRQDPLARSSRAPTSALPEIPARMFVTCLYMVLNPTTGELVFANAGHNLPSKRTVEAVVELRATGMPLGLLPGWTTTSTKRCWRRAKAS